ncbi:MULTISPECIES: hypothetical protein [unclassified Rhizobium]|jgi:hypothetical protein|uniref:hypothetical protein n=1 Tax=unclassified Rhizobium TaxID=2613769 RepID=UPI000647C9CD|nr:MULTISPECIES: hypothetical protein [unclassified Rhizobium]MBN8952931.1 hypothetical protein [Rhizobium tropici]OJY76553.1 MAG: hypothetical protein BGP09_02655 [Rhizobium sp. 60-20]RKD52656.1 hypothetical protein BJ928_114110 [Rhizobium sp. WW_1]
MGEVIKFRPAGRYGKHLDAQARMERELQLPFALADHSIRKGIRANPPDMPPVVKSKIGFPISGIAIVVGSILVYALVISHVIGQPHYSARANLMPSVFLQN